MKILFDQFLNIRLHLIVDNIIQYYLRWFATTSHTSHQVFQGKPAGGVYHRLQHQKVIVFGNLRVGLFLRFFDGALSPIKRSAYEKDQKVSGNFGYISKIFIGQGSFHPIVLEEIGFLYP